MTTQTKFTWCSAHANVVGLQIDIYCLYDENSPIFSRLSTSYWPGVKEKPLLWTVTRYCYPLNISLLSVNLKRWNNDSSIKAKIWPAALEKNIWKTHFSCNVYCRCFTMSRKLVERNIRSTINDLQLCIKVLMLLKWSKSNLTYCTYRLWNVEHLDTFDVQVCLIEVVLNSIKLFVVSISFVTMLRIFVAKS